MVNFGSITSKAILPETIIQSLQSLQRDLFDLSERNPLIKVDLNKLWFTDKPSDSKNAQKIYQKARFFEKEYGLSTALHVSHFIQWKNPRRETLVLSPLICRAVRVIEKKRETTLYTIDETNGILFVNPVLRKLFHDLFKLELPEVTETPESIVALIRDEFTSIRVQCDFDNTNDWLLIEKNAVGIFNYKKLLPAHDYEKLCTGPGSTLLHLFGEKTQKDQPVTEINHAGLLLDQSQKQAIQTALASHTVIQGPPGTGKSETIVALIKTLLLQQKKVLFVSEKRSALQVVFQRLKKEKLDLLVAFFNPEKDEKKQFYAHLRKAWESASASSLPAVNAPEKNVLHDLFSFYPDKLVTINPGSGVSIQALQEKLLQQHVDPPKTVSEIFSIDYKKWQENLEKLQHHETLINQTFGVKTIADTAFISLNSAVFKEADPVRKLAVRINQLENSLDKLTGISEKYKLDKSLHEFSRLAVTASILNMVNKNQLDLLQKDHKKFRAFNTLAKKYQLTKIKLQQAGQVNQKWSKKPSIAEITELQDLLKQKKKSKSILAVLKRNSARSNDYFAGFSPGLSVIAKLQLLEEVRTEWRLKGELESIKIRLKHELNILNPDTEIDHILQVRSKLNNSSANEYMVLLEHPDSLNLIHDLAAVHNTLNHISGLIAHLFYHIADISFIHLKNQLSGLKKELELLDQFHYELTLLFKIPEAVLNVVRQNKKTIAELDTQITWQQLQHETRFEPAFKKLSGHQLMTDFVARRTLLKKEATQQTATILQNTSDYLKNAGKLAETPVSRLTPEDRLRRQKFKDVRRTLIHEFTKKQQHLPIAELMQQHADFILSLQPVWMMNPLSVSQFLPCVANLFDYVIFDEASQVPLEDAVPSVFRAKRITVVGDSQQMPPGRFFVSNPEGKTLLDQAEITLKRVMLSYHYRSEHPGLIHFSNKHFYDFELNTLPPVTTENPIQLVHVNGVFEDSVNIPEAKELAACYKNLLEQGKTDIGIIAFSYEQQREIEKQLTKLSLPENESLIIRNLENVQGIEKEIILISVGYARNKEGVFRKNFGPVNLELGANRLNVLFTRAIQKMIIFTSVSSADFELSDNRGVNVLADFLRHAEAAESNNNPDEPTAKTEKIVQQILVQNKCSFSYYSEINNSGISCFIQHKTKKILLVDPGIQYKNFDLFSLLHALEKRFSQTGIITTNQLLLDRKSAEKEVICFFKS